MQTYMIRYETPVDVSAITRVNELAFGRPEEGRLVEKLRATPEFDARLSLVAEAEGEIVGHALFFPLTIQAEESQYPSLGLGPVAVLPDFQKQGIGSALIEAGLQTAKTMGYNASIVLGHPDYYPRFGYQPASRWGIRCQWDVPAEVFMALELNEGALEGKAGLAVYHKAFNEAT